MNTDQMAERLDQLIQRVEDGEVSPEFTPLLGVASQLSLLPSQEFKVRLKADLLAEVEATEAIHREDVLAEEEFAAQPEIMPTLRQPEFSMMPADPRSFLFSFLSHAAMVMLIASGIWMGHHTIVNNPTLVSKLTLLTLPPGDTAPHGGGSGGDHSLVAASHGTPPKFSDEQLTPPAIIVHNPTPKLQVDPSLVGPPQLKLPQSNQIGDLLSTNMAIPSNGTGGNFGIGSNHGTGIGPGGGPGFGPGTGGGCCSGAYRPGNGVSAPRAIYDPDPEYSEEARKAKFGGIVVLSVTVDPSGRPRDIRVARSLGMGLDEKAVEAVEKWKFTPGIKDGMPVAVQVNVEVSFRLY